ncbi:hypothetical protein ES703_103735 [subsurface metagenome]
MQTLAGERLVTGMKINMMKRTRTYVCIALLMNCVLFSYAEAALEVTKIQDTTVDTDAMTLSAATYGYAINGLSFQQDAVVTYNGWQYVAYYNKDGYVCLSRRQLPSGSWQRIEFTDHTLSTTSNAHKVVTMGICPNDGTIHLSFDHHGSTLNYRVSEAGVATNPASITWSTDRFGEVIHYLEAGESYPRVTYPRFWQTPDGNLQFGYRIDGSGDGDWAMVDYDGSTGLWHDTRTVISRTGTYYDACSGNSNKRNPYMNNLAYGPGGKFYATWCWREDAGGANHEIMYSFSNDGGYVWLNDESNTIRIFTDSQNESQTLLTLNIGAGEDNIVGVATGEAGTEELITLDTPGTTVVDLNSCYGMMNQTTQAVDPLGRIHTVMWHCTDESYEGYSYSRWGPQGARRYLHYFRDAQGYWHCNELPVYVGSRPKLFIRSNGDAFLIYQSRVTENPTSTGIYFIDGDLTICGATAESQWTDWEIIHTEPGFFLNEMLGDHYRFEQEEILSVMVQESPDWAGQSTPLRILDFTIE